MLSFHVVSTVFQRWKYQNLPVQFSPSFIPYVQNGTKRAFLTSTCRDAHWTSLHMLSRTRGEKWKTDMLHCHMLVIWCLHLDHLTSQSRYFNTNDKNFCKGRFMTGCAVSNYITVYHVPSTDKVRMLNHTNPLRKIKGAICTHQADSPFFFLMSTLVICKQSKEYGHHRISLLLLGYW